MKHFYKLLTCIAAFFLLGTMSSLAEINLGEVELGKTYSLTSNEYYYATLTPKEDGYMQVYSTSSGTLRAFKTWEGSAQATMALAENNYVQNKLLTSKENYGYNYEIAVKKGVTYYLCCYTLATSKFDVTVKMEPKKLEYLGSSLQQGQNSLLHQLLLCHFNSTVVWFALLQPLSMVTTKESLYQAVPLLMPAQYQRI